MNDHDPVLSLLKVTLDYKTRESFFRHRYRRALNEISLDVINALENSALQEC